MTDQSELLTLLSSLEVELHHPGVPCTEQRLNELLHHDFHEVGRSGRPYDRDYCIRFLLTHQPLSVQSTDFQVSLLAPNVALLTFKSSQQLADGRGNFALRSSVWMFENNRWQLRYHQGTAADTP